MRLFLDKQHTRGVRMLPVRTFGSSERKVLVPQGVGRWVVRRWWWTYEQPRTVEANIVLGRSIDADEHMYSTGISKTSPPQKAVSPLFLHVWGGGCTPVLVRPWTKYWQRKFLITSNTYIKYVRFWLLFTYHTYLERVDVGPSIFTCCCFHIKPFFLPNIISSTPSVLPDSSILEKYQVQIQNLWSQTMKQRKTKRRKRINVGKSSASVPGTRAQQKNATREIRATKKKLNEKKRKNSEMG